MYMCFCYSEFVCNSVVVDRKGCAIVAYFFFNRLCCRRILLAMAAIVTVAEIDDSSNCGYVKAFMLPVNNIKFHRGDPHTSPWMSHEIIICHLS
jgi:hypothetical protein